MLDLLCHIEMLHHLECNQGMLYERQFSDDMGMVKPFLVRQHAVEDNEDLVQFVSSFRLEQSFEFISVGRTSGLDHPGKVYPAGSNIVVSTEEVNTLVLYFRFFTVDQMLDLCSAHGIEFASSSQKILRTKILNVLLAHSCQEQCKHLKYVFKLLRANRRATRHNPINVDEKTAQSNAKRCNAERMRNVRRTMSDEQHEQALEKDRV